MTPTFIQAVPWNDERYVNACLLRDQTDGTIVWDAHHNGYLTFLAVMDAIGEGPGILLEDDVILADNWRDRIEAVIADHPDDVVRFFSYFPDDADLGSRWQPGKTYAQNQCVYFPPGIAAEFREYTRHRKVTAHATAYHDMTFARFLHRTHRDFWLHVPSLVQHTTWPSVVMPKRRKRVSPTFEKEMR